jgi:signal peptidase I
VSSDPHDPTLEHHPAPDPDAPPAPDPGPALDPGPSLDPGPALVGQGHLWPQAETPDPAGLSLSPPPEPDVSWPNETGGTAERAIVTDATNPLMLQRLGFWRDEIIAWVRTLVSAAVYAILIVTFGFQVARVEGESMAPTLANQDRLIVNKLIYRLGPPRKKDIVMLYYPPDPDKSFVKRVIAEEGELVKIEEGRVYVNDVPLDDDYVPQEFRSHDDFPPTMVKEGYYFVMGDHRNNSSDSRIWGEVPKKYIIGKVQLRWWPLQHARIF